MRISSPHTHPTAKVFCHKIDIKNTHQKFFATNFKSRWSYLPHKNVSKTFVENLYGSVSVQTTLLKG
jgi:hypothetical protein